MQSPLEALRAALVSSHRTCIASHMNPDGDAIGSMLALADGLKQLGKEVSLFSHDPVPKNLRFLPGWEAVQHVEVEALDGIPVWDLGFVVDVNHVPRIGRAASYVARAKVLAIIDHHQPQEDSIGDIRIIEPEAPATCLILYRILPEVGMSITHDIAQCLLTGIATDTGSFRFQNTDPASLDAASHLVALGANISLINEEVWEKKPLAAVKLLTCALDHMQLLCQGRISISHLSTENYINAHAIDEQSEGIVSEIGRVDTVLISALLREPRAGRVRVSVRSRGDIDVSAVCRQFGGGGHINAAGCTFESGIEEAKIQLVPALIACLDSC